MCDFYSFLYFGLGLLSATSELISDSVLRDHSCRAWWGHMKSGDQMQAGHMKVKHLTHCAITPALFCYFPIQSAMLLLLGCICVVEWGGIVCSQVLQDLCTWNFHWFGISAEFKSWWNEVGPFMWWQLWDVDATYGLWLPIPRVSQSFSLFGLRQSPCEFPCLGILSRLAVKLGYQPDNSCDMWGGSRDSW